ncbi:anhydro-N-acetylmuramic acid kinase [Ponticoccus sp. SC2-23]|uniref:anhydro-N-acetylmuramic acid kinase n=1 Tax=Alexandriicola marinus TaxID=2081710 RepID=UPI000FD7FE41|nr:anhydro-N-acetylmuramic acid kinase [Alexandriicola marinus]MBM1218603.1 anhydro-N-acetylmuramic acid kinase [Ponticoccus sp. SC6-9]MBM1224325.1 anhydro-N-acetylmuramic acid kinase [Ponticoccus sp. SC6-15]MBM1229896.1 anhydro-N-acetylmuramic acid kinase [Ponticoccus sp. SC6-38]MBM1233291.1 anhydro-N-acetylmuramic acid kinase [Ponticoccus sp. SC6-45]MBM1236759.1 anhydro-N-acetylmuramic acid kinase [Ponticoccus sp. SC6-49]MBM1242302.1 anhydro-N-acetylmuramic acid kinase [Ponticoccus sp. SC2-
MTAKWFAGLMTGTVLDGQIDVALVRTDGDSIAEFGHYDLVPYPQNIRDLLEETLAAARTWNFEGAEPEVFTRAEHALTVAQAEAVADVAQAARLPLTDIAAVGFHGQTVLHRAPTAARRGKTRQLGDGQLMADRLGIPVVYDLRTADVEAGGQGAPLCATYHAALLARAGAGADTAILNLGGVANLSWQSEDGQLVAFDTGPANAPINDWMKSLGLDEMDRDGALAATGHVDESRLAPLLEHPYLSAPYPKSLDRFDFTADMARGLSPEDGAALLTAFSAAAVGKGLDLLPVRPTKLIVAGGGRRNPTLMKAIAQRAGVGVEDADIHGLRGDAVEAEGFAFLAARRLLGRPISYPGTTGVPAPMTGGQLATPRNGTASR